MLSIRKVFLFLLLVPSLIFPYTIKSYYWRYNLEKGFYVLYLKFQRNKCPHKGDVLIFITPKGAIYKKQLKRNTCFVKKYFKSLKSSKFLVLVFKASNFSVERLGVVKTPLGSY